MPDISAGSLSSPGLARRRRRSSVAPFGISAVHGQPISSAPRGAGCLTIALLRAPEAEFFAPPRQEGTGRARFRARDAWPRVLGLPQLDHADRHSSDCAVHGDHVDAQLDIQHPDLGLCGLPSPRGARRHDHRRPVRRRRDRKWVRGALCRARNASGRCSAHDAQRDRAVDPADCNDTAFGRDLCVSAVVPGRARLAGRGDPAGCLVGASRGPSASISRARWWACVRPVSGSPRS